jgi:NAD(P)H-dependent nitrite reductase small subunit
MAALETQDTEDIGAIAAIVCAVDDLTPGRGVAALVGGRAVAVFRLADGAVHALDNRDPCSGASVLSRGIVGDVDGTPVVASPMYKQRFELTTGRCLDAEASVTVHAVSCADGRVRVRLAI